MSVKPRKGFTLVELLVVIGIIAVLISLLLPAMGKARSQAKKVQCSAMLRNMGQALVMYANDNKGKLPQHQSDAIWLWDVALLTRDALVKKGASRNTLYCPTFEEQNVNELWDGTFGGGNRNFGVIGYFWMGRRLSNTDPNVSSPNLPDLNGRSYLTNLKKPATPRTFPTLAPKTLAEVEVASDAVIRQGNQWAATGGWSGKHVTSHMRNGVPEGANVLYLDWHVGFKPYKAMPRPNDDVVRLRGRWGNPQIEFWF